MEGNDGDDLALPLLAYFNGVLDLLCDDEFLFDGVLPSAATDGYGYKRME
jgi:hypothetical protein